jgi:hypothetical protein
MPTEETLAFPCQTHPDWFCPHKERKSLLKLTKTLDSDIKSTNKVHHKKQTYFKSEILYVLAKIKM